MRVGLIEGDEWLVSYTSLMCCCFGYCLSLSSRIYSIDIIIKEERGQVASIQSLMKESMMIELISNLFAMISLPPDRQYISETVLQIQTELETLGFSKFGETIAIHDKIGSLRTELLKLYKSNYPEHQLDETLMMGDSIVIGILMIDDTHTLFSFTFSVCRGFQNRSTQATPVK